MGTYVVTIPLYLRRVCTMQEHHVEHATPYYRGVENKPRTTLRDRCDSIIEDIDKILDQK